MRATKFQARADRHQADAGKLTFRASLRDVNNQTHPKRFIFPQISLIFKHVMHSESKGRNGLVSLFVAMVCSALVAPCLAKESQAPLNFNAVSKLKWEECGELNNHTLECKRLHFFRF